VPLSSSNNSRRGQIGGRRVAAADRSAGDAVVEEVSMVAGGALLGAAFGGLLSWTRGHNVREGATVGASAGLVGSSLIQV